MSTNANPSDPGRPRAGDAGAPDRAIEPWFVILLSALIPLLGALFAPVAWRPALHLGGGLLCAWGLLLLIRRELAVRRHRNVTGG